MKRKNDQAGIWQRKLTLGRKGLIPIELLPAIFYQAKSFTITASNEYCAIYFSQYYQKSPFLNNEKIEYAN